jgi:hypothetical protein
MSMTLWSADVGAQHTAEMRQRKLGSWLAAAAATARRREREAPHGCGTGGDGDEWIRLGFRNLYTLHGIYWALVGRFLIRPNWNARTL